MFSSAGIQKIGNWNLTPSIYFCRIRMNLTVKNIYIYLFYTNIITWLLCGYEDISKPKEENESHSYVGLLTNIKIRFSFIAYIKTDSRWIKGHVLKRLRESIRKYKNIFKWLGKAFLSITSNLET